jgi:hypothetical protein
MWVQVLGGNPERERPLRRTGGGWEDDIKVDLTYKTQDGANIFFSLRIRKGNVLLYTWQGNF